MQGGNDSVFYIKGEFICSSLERAPHGWVVTLPAQWWWSQWAHFILSPKWTLGSWFCTSARVCLRQIKDGFIVLLYIYYQNICFVSAESYFSWWRLLFQHALFGFVSESTWCHSSRQCVLCGKLNLTKWLHLSLCSLGSSQRFWDLPVRHTSLRTVRPYEIIVYFQANDLWFYS